MYNGTPQELKLNNEQPHSLPGLQGQTKVHSEFIQKFHRRGPHISGTKISQIGFMRFYLNFGQLICSIKNQKI